MRFKLNIYKNKFEKNWIEFYCLSVLFARLWLNTEPGFFDRSRKLISINLEKSNKQIDSER